MAETHSSPQLNYEELNNNKSSIVILTVPFPAQSHLNQLLQFSCLIASYSLPVHYVASAVHNRQAKSRVAGIISEKVTTIHFHDMPLPSFDSPTADPDSSDKFPSQLLPSWYASLSLRKPFAAYLQKMSENYRRVIIIHDSMMAAVVQDVALIHNAESYIFNCLSPFFRVPFILAKLGKPLPSDYPDLPTFEGCISKDMMEFGAIHQEFWGLSNGEIHNTCRMIEAPYLGLLEREDMLLHNKKSWAVGPIVPMLKKPENNRLETRHECLKWLDDQEPNSVIYISFGTTTSLSNEQIKELAYGLEQSKVKFLWILRDADKADIFDDQEKRRVPDSLEEHIKGTGFLYRDWAPQPEILTHSSIGGFMSHCGWNSCIESMTVGVPIAAWPMHSDQPINATFITEVLKIGLIVRDWSKRDELVKAQTIETIVQRLIVTDEGIGLRKKAKELAITIQKATEEGGASRVEMDSFVSYITR